MGGDALLSWLTTLVIGAVVVLLLGIAAVLLPRMSGLVTVQFHCPWSGRDVVVRYQTGDGRRRVGVVSCTAFADPRVVTCAMPCLGDARG